MTGETNLTWTGNVFETNGGVENWTMRARSTGPSSRIGFQNQYLTNGYTIGCGAANQSFVVYTGGNNDRLRIDSTGITTFSQNVFFNKDIDVDGHTNLDNVSIAGVVTATSFVGALPISADANNRVITATGSGGLQAEPNITFDSTNLRIGTDSGFLSLGLHGDLKLYHDGSNSYIEDLSLIHI